MTLLTFIISLIKSGYWHVFLLHYICSSLMYIVFCFKSFRLWICWFSFSFLLFVSPFFPLFSFPHLCLLPVLCAEVAQLIGLLAGGKRLSLTMTVTVWRGRRRGRLFCFGRISVVTTVWTSPPQHPAHLILTERLTSRYLTKSPLY